MATVQGGVSGLVTGAVFNTAEWQHLSLAGSIPVRLRQHTPLRLVKRGPNPPDGLPEPRAHTRAPLTSDPPHPAPGPVDRTPPGRTAKRCTGVHGPLRPSSSPGTSAPDTSTSAPGFSAPIAYSRRPDWPRP